ncbi:hypothetical protein EDB89DRAFT_1903385 [Lactarius sanguifluus]|nr:hypothetical protein EDB89DRAFT_1903385 [Lactarius sanguifluus]
MYIARHHLHGCGCGLHWGDVAGSWHAKLGRGSGWRSCMLCWGGEVGWWWQHVGAGWRWLVCMNGLQHPGFCVLCWGGAVGWQWRHVVSHVRAVCWGRDEWKQLACMRGWQWLETLKVNGKKKNRTYLVHWAKGQLVLSHILYLA